MPPTPLRHFRHDEALPSCRSERDTLPRRHERPADDAAARAPLMPPRFRAELILRCRQRRVFRAAASADAVERRRCRAERQRQMMRRAPPPLRPPRCRLRRAATLSEPRRLFEERRREPMRHYCLHYATPFTPPYESRHAEFTPSRRAPPTPMPPSAAERAAERHLRYESDAIYDAPRASPRDTRHQRRADAADAATPPPIRVRAAPLSPLTRYDVVEAASIRC